MAKKSGGKLIEKGSIVGVLYVRTLEVPMYF